MIEASTPVTPPQAAYPKLGSTDRCHVAAPGPRADGWSRPTGRCSRRTASASAIALCPSMAPWGPM